MNRARMFQSIPDEWVSRGYADTSPPASAVMIAFPQTRRVQKTAARVAHAQLVASDAWRAA
jgi:hypothetical protein